MKHLLWTLILSNKLTHIRQNSGKKKPKKIKSMCVRAQEEIEAKKKNKISQDHGIKLAMALAYSLYLHVKIL
jgi:hypothetical protein